MGANCPRCENPTETAGFWCESCRGEYRAYCAKLWDFALRKRKILPNCFHCGGKLEGFSASFADIYDQAAIYDTPDAGFSQLRGYKCTKCGEFHEL